jgi:E3 ubiquitin-protein ligase UBR7
VPSEEAAQLNRYNQNFQNKFCGCGEEYDAEQEKGTMYQCLGLGNVETGGCGEDWWHPECLMGLPRNWRKQPRSGIHPSHAKENVDANAEVPDTEEDDPTPPGFPEEDDFEALVCYKCVESNPWIKQYANTPGFLPPLFKRNGNSTLKNGADSAKPQVIATDVGGATTTVESRKRKASEDIDSRSSSPAKRVKEGIQQEKSSGKAELKDESTPKQKHDLLLPAPEGTFSLFLKEDFRDHICHCPKCYQNLIPHPQLLEEEDIYQPPVSENADSEAGPGSGARSHGTGSLLERGEAALSSMDRVRAIEGVMVYNHLKDKVKDFLKPYAESGKAVGAEDIKAYFEKLRGDDTTIREAGHKPGTGDEDKENEGGTDSRREQSGY